MRYFMLLLGRHHLLGSVQARRFDLSQAFTQKFVTMSFSFNFASDDIDNDEGPGAAAPRDETASDALVQEAQVPVIKHSLSEMV